MHILNVPIDTLTRAEILARVEDFLEEPRFHRIATVNPEFLLLAEKNKVFRTALLEADLRIADGFGIVLAGLLRGKYIRRFPGADLMDAILHIADHKKLSIYLAVRADGLSTFDEIRSAILGKYPHLIIDGTDIDSSNWKSETSGQYSKKIFQLPVTGYQLLFCNFGAPEQELFLESLRSDPGDIRLALGVGGSLDYLTGRQKRAPQWLRTIGLEWLWRLILQPKRLKRIWNAVCVFPFRIIFATVIMIGK